MNKIGLIIVLIVFLVALLVSPLAAQAEELMGNKGGCGQRNYYTGKVVSVTRSGFRWSVTVEVPDLGYSRYTARTSHKFALRSSVGIEGCVADDNPDGTAKSITGPFVLSKL